MRFSRATWIFRLLLRRPGFLVATVSILALGIGATVTIFALVHGVLLRPLPFAEPQRLVTIWTNLNQAGQEKVAVSPAEFAYYRQESRFLADISAYAWRGFNLSGLEQPRRIVGAEVSAGFLRVLGVPPLHGRVFVDGEDRAEGARVVVMSHRLWRESFHGDASVVGSAIRLDGESYQVVGIMPRGFEFPFRFVGVWKPMSLSPETLRDLDARDFNVIARLRPDRDIPQAQAEMSRLAGDLAQSHSGHFPNGLESRLIPLQEEIVGDVRLVLLILLAAVILVLLIACANVAGLMLTHLNARRGELAVRAALGAGRWRLGAYLMVESLILAGLGSIFGVALSYWGVAVVKTAQPLGLPRIDEVAIDTRILLVSFGFMLLVGLFLGFLVASQISKSNLGDVLKDHRSLGSAASSMLRNALVASEIALAVLLLVGAGLLVRSYQTLQTVDPGYRSERTLTTRIVLPTTKYGWFGVRRNFFRQLLERIRALPGVEDVAAVSALPLSDVRITRGFSVESAAADTGLKMVQSDYVVVSPNYLKLMGIALRSGQGFPPGDPGSGPPRILVNETMARRSWPGEKPIGKRLKIGRRGSRFPWMTVVGVIRDVKQKTIVAASEPEVYVSYLQPGLLAHPVGAMFVVAKCASHPEALAPLVQREVLAMDADQPIVNVMTMQGRLSDSVAQERFNMSVLSTFAVLALLLAVAGIYGLVSNSVGQRTRELGVRLALGASRGEILRLVLFQGLKLAAVGIAVGVAAALVLGRLLASLLYGLSPYDPTTIISTSLVLSVVALAACSVPAFRATRVDPIIALRQD